MSKQKPGVKTGAIDSLTRRLGKSSLCCISIFCLEAPDRGTIVSAEVLEEILLDESGARKPQMAFLDDNPELLNSLSALERQIQNEDRHQTFHQSHLNSDDGALVSDSAASPALASSSGHKRRRTNYMDYNPWDEDDGPPPPPPLYLLDPIIDIHFRTVHHWVPILHEARFLAKLADPDERNRLAVLLHSIVAVAIKYLDVDKVQLSRSGVETQIKLSRKIVMLHAMQSVSIENIQALIFLAFDYVSCPIT